MFYNSQELYLINSRFRSNDTWKLVNLQVLLPGNWPISRYLLLEITTKKTLFCKYLHENKNIFKNIFVGYSRPRVLLIHEKNQTSKISC